jgi:hypothetical protein
VNAPTIDLTAEYDVEDVARMFNVAEDTVREWIDDGTLPFHRYVEAGPPIIVGVHLEVALERMWGRAVDEMTGERRG